MICNFGVKLFHCLGWKKLEFKFCHKNNEKLYLIRNIGYEVTNTML